LLSLRRHDIQRQGAVGHDSVDVSRLELGQPLRVLNHHRDVDLVDKSSVLVVVVGMAFEGVPN
jgi:hypothetical protein